METPILTNENMEFKGAFKYSPETQLFIDYLVIREAVQLAELKQEAESKKVIKLSTDTGKSSENNLDVTHGVMGLPTGLKESSGSGLKMCDILEKLHESSKKFEKNSGNVLDVFQKFMGLPTGCEKNSGSDLKTCGILERIHQSHKEFEKNFVLDVFQKAMGLPTGLKENSGSGLKMCDILEKLHDSSKEFEKDSANVLDVFQKFMGLPTGLKENSGSGFKMCDILEKLHESHKEFEENSKSNTGNNFDVLHGIIKLPTKPEIIERSTEREVLERPTESEKTRSNGIFDEFAVIHSIVMGSNKNSESKLMKYFQIPQEMSTESEQNSGTISERSFETTSDIFLSCMDFDKNSRSGLESSSDQEIAEASFGLENDLENSDVPFELKKFEWSSDSESSSWSALQSEIEVISDDEDIEIILDGIVDTETNLETEF